MFFTVTIDTEEDNWGEYTRSSYSVENVRRVPALQHLFDAYDVRPTYLISHPVASNPAAIAVLGEFQDRGCCEIGTHPHPWNTPPVTEQRTAFNSFISNLPSRLQFEKIKTLTDTITRNFGVRPTSYRSGRWGFSEELAGNLIRLGYRVDSSVHPVWDWSGIGGPDFSQCGPEPFVYRLAGTSGGAGELLEVPPSVDFLQPNRPAASRVLHGIKRLPLGDKLAAVLAKLRLLNHVCVSPELHPAASMVRLATVMRDRGARVVNMFFHSPSLLEGCSPFVRSSADAMAFLASIETFLKFARSAGLRPVTMSQLTADEVGAWKIRQLPHPAIGDANL